MDLSKEQMMKELIDKKQDMFYVIGEDRKIHTSKLHTNKTTCGIKINKKYVTSLDYHKHFSCYSCTWS